MAQVQLFIVMTIFGLAVAQFHQQTNQFGAQPQFGQQQYQQPQQQYQQRSSSCPDVNGTYPVSGQCDAYIECKNGVAEEKLCPDGLLFNDKLGPKHFPCQYPIDVSCDNRAKLQPAQSTDECPHQFGYYKMGDRSNCGQFMNCVNGRGFMFDCPEGLAWSQETYRCEWPDQVPDCDAESFVGFTCPPEARTDTLTDYTFYRSAADCQVYYICIEGRPRMYRCSEGKLFNDLTNQCDGAENVTCGGASYRTPAKPVQIQQTSQPRPNVHVSQFNQQQQPKTQFNAFSGIQQQTVQQQTVQPAVAPQQKYYTGLVVPQEQPKQQQQFYTGKIVPQQQKQQQFFTGAVVPQAKAVNTFTSFNPTTVQPIVVQDDAVDPFINPRFGSGQEAAPVAPQSQFNSFAAVQPAVVQPRQPESPRFQTRSSINTFGQFNAQSSNRGQKRWEGTF